MMIHSILFAVVACQIAPVSKEAPNRQPQFAAGARDVQLVFGSEHAIWFARSKDEGKSFSEPTKVADFPALALGRHRGPRIVISGQTTLVSAVGGSTVASGPHAHGLPADGNLLIWRSTDEGHTWSDPVTVNDVPGAAREGLHTMTVAADGTVAAAWLDLRSQGTRLVGSISRDAGKTWSKNILLYQSPDGTICQCCAPSLTSTGAGEFAVMFRNVMAGARDLYVLRWKDGQSISSAEKLGTGSWKLNACPMDGGGIASDQGRLISAWRRGDTIFQAEQGKPETPIAQGKDVALAVGRKGPYVAWSGSDGIHAKLPNQAMPISLSKAGAFPTLVRLPNGSVFAAWEEDNSIFTRVLE
jgi:BNR repeat protein